MISFIPCITSGRRFGSSPDATSCGVPLPLRFEGESSPPKCLIVGWALMLNIEVTGRVLISGAPVRELSKGGRGVPGPRWGDGLEDENPFGSVCKREDLVMWGVSVGVS